MLKNIQTNYKGYLFRSRLEARWAIFFDACGVDYEYEPEGFDLKDGLKYLPDFLLHGVVGRSGGDLYVEVKGKMSQADAIKIRKFADYGKAENNEIGKRLTAILVLSRIPDGETVEEILCNIQESAYPDNSDYPAPFNFETIDGDYFATYPGINKDGKFELFGDDSNYLMSMDEIKTEKAYRLARQARFEFGQTPEVIGGKDNA